jgi:hypothetical protein
MKRAIFASVAILILAGSVRAQAEPTPPVIAKMEELGTVFVTRANPKVKTSARSQAKNKVIVGIDFRPTAGSDPKKVAAAVKELATLPDLKTVLLLGQDVTDEAAGALPASVKLVSIQFFNTSITDKGIAGLARLKSLQTFKFTGMGLTDEGMKSLAKIKTLQVIVITDAKVTDDGVLALRTLRNLRQLTIENTEATEQSIERLRESLPRLASGERFLM